jgi:hypothetical protein
MVYGTALGKAKIQPVVAIAASSLLPMPGDVWGR